MASKPGTRRFVSDRVTVTIGSELGNAVNRLVRDVAGDVVDAIEAIVSDTAKETRDKWYTLVRRRTGRSGDGTDYRLEIKGDTIRGVVFNDAKAFAKRDVNTNLQGQLLPGFTQKAEVFQATEEYYAYFVHAPEALSMVFQRSTLAEYRELMRYFRRTGALPPGYRASALTDSKGRRRPVGIAKLVRNPKASDGKRVWDTLVVKGSKAIVDQHALSLDKALTVSGQKLAKR